tara:strand:+ start:469 stop:726 length:258 start_codon:yes stop_codon:yes gene_type:complete
MSRENLKGKFLGEILNYELKKHDWKNADDCDKVKIRILVKDAYKLGLDPADYFYKFCPVEGIDEREYGIKKTWQQVMDQKAKEQI